MECTAGPAHSQSQGQVKPSPPSNSRSVFISLIKRSQRILSFPLQHISFSIQVSPKLQSNPHSPSRRPWLRSSNPLPSNRPSNYACSSPLPSPTSISTLHFTLPAGFLCGIRTLSFSFCLFFVSRRRTRRRSPPRAQEPRRLQRHHSPPLLLRPLPPPPPGPSPPPDPHLHRPFQALRGLIDSRPSDLTCHELLETVCAVPFPHYVFEFLPWVLAVSLVVCCRSGGEEAIDLAVVAEPRGAQEVSRDGVRLVVSDVRRDPVHSVLVHVPRSLRWWSDHRGKGSSFDAPIHVLMKWRPAT